MIHYIEHENEWFIIAHPHVIGVQRNGVKKWVKVEDDAEHIYKLMKTKIKASGGASGLYDYLDRNIKADFSLCNVNKVLNHIFFEMREVA